MPDTAERPDLTAGQERVYAAILGFWRDQQRPPSARDLCGLLGIASTYGVTRHLAELARKGRIDWDRSNTARAIWPAGLRAGIRAVVAELSKDA